MKSTKVLVSKAPISRIPARRMKGSKSSTEVKESLVTYHLGASSGVIHLCLQDPHFRREEIPIYNDVGDTFLIYLLHNTKPRLQTPSNIFNHIYTFAMSPTGIPDITTSTSTPAGHPDPELGTGTLDSALGEDESSEGLSERDQ